LRRRVRKSAIGSVCMYLLSLAPLTRGGYQLAFHNARVISPFSAIPRKTDFGTSETYGYITARARARSTCSGFA